MSLRWPALVLVVAAGCGDENDGSDARAARKAWCEAGCAAAARCEGGVVSDCAERCEQQSTGFFLRMTPNALSAQAECLARASSCTDGAEVLFSDCEREVWLDFPATELSVTTCEALAAPLFECHWFDSLAQCASFHATFTEPALTAWQNCSGVFDCEALGQCAEATLYDYGD